MNFLTPRAPGRSRNEDSHQAILGAAYELAAKKGYYHVSLQDIANEASVGRPTIYRWWPNKSLLYLEVLMDKFAQAATALSPKENDFEAYLKSILGVARENLNEITLALLLEAQRDATLQTKLQSFLLERRAMLRLNIERTLKSQKAELAAPVDTVLDALLGASWYRFMSDSNPIDDKFAYELVAIFNTLAHAKNPDA
jgi:AcrR family transcriptional regulator